MPGCRSGAGAGQSGGRAPQRIAVRPPGSRIRCLEHHFGQHVVRIRFPDPLRHDPPRPRGAKLQAGAEVGGFGPRTRCAGVSVDTGAADRSRGRAGSPYRESAGSRCRPGSGRTDSDTAHRGSREPARDVAQRGVDRCRHPVRHPPSGRGLPAGRSRQCVARRPLGAVGNSPRSRSRRARPSPDRWCARERTARHQGSAAEYGGQPGDVVGRRTERGLDRPGRPAGRRRRDCRHPRSDRLGPGVDPVSGLRGDSPADRYGPGRRAIGRAESAQLDRRGSRLPSARPEDGRRVHDAGRRDQSDDRRPQAVLA